MLIDLHVKNESRASGIIDTNALHTAFFIGNSSKEFSEKLGQLDGQTIVHFVTNGVWSMPALLSYCLSVTGPCHLHLTSWAFSESSARVIFGLHKKGFIREFTCLLDFCVMNRSSSAVNLLKGMATRFKMAHCHAKVMVLENEKYHLTIVSSANFNQNPRIEVGCIFKDADTAAFHKNWIDNEFNN